METVEHRKDFLMTLLSRHQISFSEYLAGREWQDYMEAVELQGTTCFDWDTPYMLQARPIYQRCGHLSDKQSDAFDVRRIIREEIGNVAFGDLDRLLSMPEWAKVRLSEAGVTYVSRLLQIVSVILDIQAGGSEFGAEAEDWERNPAEERIRLLRQTQPWLFDGFKKRAGQKLSANQILGKQL